MSRRSMGAQQKLPSDRAREKTNDGPGEELASQENCRSGQDRGGNREPAPQIRRGRARRRSPVPARPPWSRSPGWRWRTTGGRGPSSSSIPLRQQNRQTCSRRNGRVPPPHTGQTGNVQLSEFGPCSVLGQKVLGHPPARGNAEHTGRAPAGLVCTCLSAGRAWRSCGGRRGAGTPPRTDGPCGTGPRRPPARPR